ncbi:hypothetical protein DFK10_11890 [Salibaculum griseiflavum]|uniref:Uncharacterized protein n=1 Tax=Salibaculum griseiflavum TaxID=1914409 RepID=A0A2V1P3K7_9RHOB|nr:hypothetical protein DFK10_11890 [Salibaculum griseiflavum]
MNWAQCAERMEDYMPGWRLMWPSDGIEFFDCEAGLTISDVWGAISWIWTYPGDWILSQEPLRTFFEIEGQTAVGATGSTILGWLIFLILAGLVSN